MSFLRKLRPFFHRDHARAAKCPAPWNARPLLEPLEPRQLLTDWYARSGPPGGHGTMNDPWGTIADVNAAIAS
jgi:hypothetical protein